jgi:hypothetical protein
MVNGISLQLTVGGSVRITAPMAPLATPLPGGAFFLQEWFLAREVSCKR